MKGGARSLFKQDRTILSEKFKESIASVLPVTMIVFLLCFFLTPVPVGMLMAFVMGAAMLIVGMTLFTLGTDLAMTPIGEHIGSSITKSRKLLLIVPISLLLGVIITMAEPDLQVLAEQVPGVPNFTLIICVAAGVGVFLVIAVLRIIFGVKLKYLLIGFYALVFIVVWFVPMGFRAVAFDSGGVTTGPMTVPFIMALGVGIASIRSDKNAEADSFGLVALCSIGPIIAVLILGAVYGAEGSVYVPATVPIVTDSRDLWLMFVESLPRYLGEVAIALAPIVTFFLIMQMIKLRLHRYQVIKIVIGLVYTYIGLVLFLGGVSTGFMSIGNFIGRSIGALENNWIIIPIGMLIGYFIVVAEPAVHVLNKQVAEITSGAIPKKAMSTSLSIGVSISVGLAMLRIVTGISIMWLIIPGYLIASVLTFFAPPVFTAIAFDSGGVASGPMTATFLLPLAIGVCGGAGGNVVTDAFGVVAMVAMTPLITIQVMGIYFKRKERAVEKAEAPRRADTEQEIITFEEE